MVRRPGSGSRAAPWNSSPERPVRRETWTALHPDFGPLPIDPPLSTSWAHLGGLLCRRPECSLAEVCVGRSPARTELHLRASGRLRRRCLPDKILAGTRRRRA